LSATLKKREGEFDRPGSGQRGGKGKKGKGGRRSKGRGGGGRRHLSLLVLKEKGVMNPDGRKKKELLCAHRGNKEHKKTKKEGEIK